MAAPSNLLAPPAGAMIDTPPRESVATRCTRCTRRRAGGAAGPSGCSSGAGDDTRLSNYAPGPDGADPGLRTLGDYTRERGDRAVLKFPRLPELVLTFAPLVEE